MRIRRIILAAAVCSFYMAANPARAQGTSFTYQGRLNTNGNPANGNYSFTFKLFTTNSGGSPVRGPVTNAGVLVTNGLFTVSVDFGAGAWNGSTNWLEIAVETNGGSGFTTLTPRQEATPSPYAIYAENATMLSTGSALGAGSDNSISSAGAPNSFVGGGTSNSVQMGASSSFIGGGNQNVAAGQMAAVGGGQGNDAAGFAATVAGGTQNEASGDYSFVGGGSFNVANRYDVIGGGQSNVVASDFSGIFTGQGNNIGETGSLWSFIGGGTGNSIASGAQNAAIGGGYKNRIQANALEATVGGGMSNIETGSATFIGGGIANSINPSAGQFPGPIGIGSAISGGLTNTIVDGIPAGPFPNLAGANIVGGGSINVISCANGALANTIAGGQSNSMNGGNIQMFYNTISGGGQNEMGEPDSGFSGCVISGGVGNLMVGGLSYNGCTIAGGAGNSMGNFSSSYSDCVIGGGALNFVDGSADTITGGQGNTIESQMVGNNQGSAIGGGIANTVTNGSYGVIGGGASNTVAGNYGIVPGGVGNYAGSNSFAAGSGALATFVGDFVWADASGGTIGAGGPNQVVFRCRGGVTFASGSGGTDQQVSWVPGTGAWSFTSDRGAKENFTPVDSRQVLDRVAHLPLTEWNYKGYGERHVGPMAQDFHEAFPLNGNDKMLNSADEAGITLAAVQGLNEKLDEKDAEIQNLRRQNDALSARLSELETAVKQLSAQK